MRRCAAPRSWPSPWRWRSRRSAAGNLWIGIAGIVAFGLPHAFYNALVQVWAADRFSDHGQGAVMGLLSTTFCLANILMAAAGAVLTLIDTRLILLTGAGLTAWAAWRMRAWSRAAIAPAGAAGVAPGTATADAAE